MGAIIKDTLQKVKPDLEMAKKDLKDLEDLIEVQRKMGIDVSEIVKEYTGLKDAIERMEGVLKEYGFALEEGKK